MRIVNLLCDAQDNGLSIRATERLSSEGIDVDIWQYGISDLDSEERYFSELLSILDDTKLIIIRVHSGLTCFKKFERLKEAIVSKKIPLVVQSEMPQDMEDNRELFLRSEEEHMEILRYLEFGGDDNEYNLLKWLLKVLGNADVRPERPSACPAQGLYFPGKGMVDSVCIDPNKATVSLLFNQTNYVSGNLKHIDRLAEELTSRGVNVLPVFLTTNPSRITGSIGIIGTAEKYLMKGGKPLIDAAVLTMGFSQICMSDPSNENRGNIFSELGVPVIQAPALLGSEKDWESNPGGLGAFELSMSVFWPEFDGQIISVPLASTERAADGRSEYIPIEGRVTAIADLAVRWAALRHKSNAHKRIAILLHQNPPRRDMIGGAFGLDAAESTVNLLRLMGSRGYDVEGTPGSGQELSERLLEGVSNDNDWMSSEEMAERGAAVVPVKEYLSWLSDIDKGCGMKMTEDWGPPPGDINTTAGGIVIPGTVFGNVFIGIQPNRGYLGSDADIYHSQEVVAPHNYLAYYKWLEKVFKADAVIHMGCHGTLEWLPGKGTGLSRKCYPDLVLGHIPHIYPYAISNPGEGMNAKRRSWAVIIDHLIPSMTKACGYDEISSLEAMVQDHLRASAAGQEEKCRGILDKLYDSCQNMNILPEIGLSRTSSLKDLEPKVSELYDYISQIKGNMIKNGLHILGVPPEGIALDDMIFSVVRMGNGKVRSIRDLIASHNGFSIKDLSSRPSETDATTGKLYGEILDSIDDECLEIIKNMREAGFDPARCREILRSATGESEDSRALSDLMCQLSKNIEMTINESENLLDALDGKYIMPGPSGCITRGNAHLLPTGMNFYSIDPESIPTMPSWKVGRDMADRMVERYIDEKGAYPKQVGLVLWSTDTMKTGGDDIAYALWLLGLEPLWAASGGAVTGLRVIPPKELGRPRIDVTLRISGLFRDSFPNLIRLIDDGIKMISELDESDEDNYLLANLRKDLAENISSGLDPVLAKRRARVRIFGDPPGNYGGGVDTLIESSEWKDKNDLKRAFLEWGGYAYGTDLSGEDMKDFFTKRLGGIDVTVKNHESRELDILDNDDDFVFLGGMNAAVEAIRGEKPVSMIGDSSDPDAVGVRTLQEETSFVFRSRVLNPKWVSGLKRHGYRGVQELSNLVDYTLGWDSTSGSIEDWMYESISERFLFDGDNRKWIEDSNPDALLNMSSRLLEAAERGLWNANPETLDRIRSIFTDAETAVEHLGQ